MQVVLMGTDGPEKLTASASRMGNPLKSQGVRQAFLPTQRFRKPLESGEPASPTSPASSVCLLETPASECTGGLREAPCACDERS